MAGLVPAIFFAERRAVAVHRAKAGGMADAKLYLRPIGFLYGDTAARPAQPSEGSSPRKTLRDRATPISAWYSSA